MKRKYLNSEKVSNRYLLMRYEELKAKFAEFRKRKMSFAIQKFDVELNQIYNDAELNNYQKLRKIIELEREFNKYLKTKEFLTNRF